MRIKWQRRWFETEEQARGFIHEIESGTVEVWELDLRKVNKANKQYTHGYTLDWYWGKPK